MAEMRGTLCLLALLGAATLAGAACAPVPSETVRAHDLLMHIEFDQPFDWEQYVDPARSIAFTIENSAYRAQARDDGFMWVVHPTLQDDVVMQVDVENLGEDGVNAYGLMCRASPTSNGNGYYFLISADGAYTIRRGALDTIDALVYWARSSAIRQGRALNRVRAACVGDYLQLEINGQFVAEARDDRYQSGYPGLAGGAPQGYMLDVAFDSLRIWSASLADAAAP
jgi:hypothetical protein